MNSLHQITCNRSWNYRSFPFKNKAILNRHFISHVVIWRDDTWQGGFLFRPALLNYGLKDLETRRFRFLIASAGVSRLTLADTLACWCFRTPVVLIHLPQEHKLWKGCQANSIFFTLARTSMLYFCKRRIVPCNIHGAWYNGFLRINSRGLWSE